MSAERVVDSLPGSVLVSRPQMAVHVQHHRGIRVAEPVGNNPHPLPGADQRRRERVPQIVHGRRNPAARTAGCHTRALNVEQDNGAPVAVVKMNPSAVVG